MFSLDRLDRAAFSDFLTFAREHVVLSLKESLTSGNNGETVKSSNNTRSGNDGDEKLRGVLVNAENVLCKADEMLALNVSAGHISGFICANLIALHT